MTAEMRADWVDPDALRLLLTAMMPANALAMEVAMSTGMRIGDVLAIRTEQARKPRFTIKEEKTGKARRIYLPRKLRERMFEQAGRFYVWEGRTDPTKHRTRQAVYKDLARVAKLYRLDGRKLQEHVSTHTARKVWAVERFHETGDAAQVQREMNHTQGAVTALYILADELTKRRTGCKLKEK